MPIQTPSPEFVNGTDLGTFRAGNNAVIIASAVDPAPGQGPLTYSASNLPNNLNIDTDLGVVYGFLPIQDEYLKKYTVTINATKYYTSASVYVTATNICTLSIKGGDQDHISWISTEKLGTIPLGTPSMLSMQATHTETMYNLTYNLASSSYELQDAGLFLNSSGHIIGTPTSTGTYYFNVFASTVTNYYSESNPDQPITIYLTAYAQQSFELSVISVNSAAYTNIYIEPFLTIPKRKNYQSFITNTSTFIPSLLYRNDDPNFGVQTDLKMALEYGIEQLNLTEYTNALRYYFYRRRFKLSQPRSIQGFDVQGNYIYDAVCVDVGDEDHELVRMRTQLAQLPVTFESSYIPRFMYDINNQPAYQPVIILCYARPGYGGRIIRNILKTEFDFNAIDFEIDRIVVEQSLDNLTAKYLEFPRRSLYDPLPVDPLFGPDGIELFDENGVPITRE